MNIVSVDEFASESQFEAHFRCLPRVVLEGDSDVELFSEWFEPLLAELDFVSAKSLVEGNGCTAVLPAVIKSREVDEIPAVGIVDRDRFHRVKQWDVLFTLDDADIEAAALDPDIYTTLLWEIEAYLLRPELIADWVRMQRDPPPATVGERQQALGRAVEECEALLEAAPFFCSAHHIGLACDNRYFQDVPHTGVAAACTAGLHQVSAQRKQTADHVQARIAVIKQAAPNDLAERLVFYLRYVDTKRLIIRLINRLGLHKEEPHHILTGLMSMKGLYPEELEEFLKSAAKRFAG